MEKFKYDVNDFKKPNQLAIVMTQTFMNMNEPIDDWVTFSNTFLFTYLFFCGSVEEVIQEPQKLGKIIDFVRKNGNK